MALGTVTITAPTGPGVTVTARTYTDVRKVTFDCNLSMISIQKNDDTWDNYDAKAVGTVTVAASSGTFTFTIS